MVKFKYHRYDIWTAGVKASQMNGELKKTNMSENIKTYYFSIVKLCCMIILLTYFVTNSEKSLRAISVEWFLIAITMSVTVSYELIKNKKAYFLYAEAIMTIIAFVFFKDSGNWLFLLPMVVLDFITYFKQNFAFCLLIFLGVLLNTDNFFIYLAYCMVIIIIYFQKYLIADQYKKYLDSYEQEEFQLKDSIAMKDNSLKKALEKNGIYFENKILEEKSRLSQALHDKLGHSINGSIYQLEACKILLEKNPEESTNMIQRVIDNLRTSMDEIRCILKKEKPDKRQMALLQLIGLCEECEKEYGILAEVKFEGEDKEIPERLWEVILDNTFEAVTNALKYSSCKKILIEITILHKVIRCSIRDDGVGCHTISEGMGIQGMKERTRKINGYIDANGDKGFCINMILPLQGE